MLERVTLALLLLAQLCSAGRDEDLQTCLCYDSATNAGCTGSFTDQCEDYGKTLLFTLYPSAVCCIIFAIVFPLILFMRSCCNTCGGREPSEGCMCTSKEDFRGYSFCDRCRIKLLVLLFAVAAAALALATLVKSADVSDGIKDLTDITGALVGNIDTAADTMTVQYAKFPSDIVSTSDKAAIQDAVYIVKNGTKDIMDVIDDIDAYDYSKWYSRHKLTIGFSIVIVLIFLFGGLGAMCGMKRTTASVFVTLLLVFGSIYCYITAVYQLGSFALDDICDSYPASTQQVLNRIQSNLGCASGASGLNQIIQQTETAKQSFADQLCPNICSDSLFTCSSSCNPIAYGTLYLIPDNSEPANPSDAMYAGCETPCTVAKCAEQCVAGSTAQLAAQYAVGNITSIGDIVTAITTSVYPVANCSVLTTYFTDVEEPLCTTAKEPAHHLWLVTLFIMFFIVIGAVVMLIGSKRFSSEHSTKSYKNIENDRAYGNAKITYGTDRV